MPTPHQERIAKVQEQVQRACAKHGLMAVWEAYLRFKADEPDEGALTALGIDNPYIADERPLQALHAQLSPEYLAREQIVFYLKADTLDTKHAFMPLTADGLGYNDAHSREDQNNGWKPIMAANSHYYSPARIDETLAQNIASAKAFWLELLKNRVDTRVVANGEHYVAHAVGTGHGFYGRKFVIHWLDSSLAPTVCNLSHQGTVPAWIRAEMPDNASIAAYD